MSHACEDNVCLRRLGLAINREENIVSILRTAPDVDTIYNDHVAVLPTAPTKPIRTNNTYLLYNPLHNLVPTARVIPYSM